MASGPYVKSFSSLYGRTAYSSFSNMTPEMQGERKPFSPPSSELRVANARRQAQFENQPPKNQKNQDNSTKISAQMGGQNVETALEKTKSANISGGSALTVRGGEMNFTTSGGKSLKLAEGTQARIFRNESGKLVLQNLDKDEEITVQQGENISISGQGKAELSGKTRSLTLKSGEKVTARAAGGNKTQLVRSSTANKLKLTEEGQQISVSENNLTFLAESGKAIEFTPGQRGTISRTEDNQIKISNSDTGEAITFSPKSALSSIGKGTASVAEGQMTIEGSQGLQLNSSETEGTTLVQPDTAKATAVEKLDQRPGIQGGLSVEVYSNPRNERLKLETKKLLQEPLAEAKKAQKERKEEKAEEDKKAKKEQKAVEAQEKVEKEAEDKAADKAQAEAKSTEKKEEFLQINETEGEKDTYVSNAETETGSSAFSTGAETNSYRSVAFSENSTGNNFYTPDGRAQLSGSQINYSV